MMGGRKRSPYKFTFHGKRIEIHYVSGFDAANETFMYRVEVGGERYCLPGRNYHVVATKVRTFMRDEKAKEDRIKRLKELNNKTL